MRLTPETIDSALASARELQHAAADLAASLEKEIGE